MVIIFVLILLGLAWGSFVNAFVWRLHEQQKSTKKKAHKDLSILKGRSMCPDCRHTLATKDLVPVLSWLSLGGKCRYCRKPISAQYPAVELLTAALFVLSYLFWPYGFLTAGIVQLVIWLATLVVFMILFVYDLRWMILPNKVVYPLIGLTVINVGLQVVLTSNLGLLVQAFWGVICLAGLFYALFQISGGKWIGGGDVKLAIALGLLVGGPVKALLLIFIASLLGVIITLPLLVQGKKSYTSRIPFGPFLIAASIIVYIFGNSLINIYLKHILGI
jgi:prepilin signal peptidase PulO-like enzyme (type II secretory pathway)